jgi:hypothetical protein
MAKSCRDWLAEIPEGESLTKKETAHPKCIKCHLQRKAEKKDSGPVYCKECHSGIRRPLEELADIPRLECEQEEKILIKVKDARMNYVPFDHKSHEADTRFCQTCHHDTMDACNTCHTLKGIEEGNYITLSEAYHDVSSQLSCIGCHESKKKEAECAGCHHLLKTGLIKSACNSCHTGTLESLENSSTLAAPDLLYPDDLKKEMEINLIENEYGSSKFPHDEIAKKLTEISNKSKLARYFHKNEMSICQGCHHYVPIDEKANLPLCSACHLVREKPDEPATDLLGAYHRQCLGCHKHMGKSENKILPKECKECHEEKAKSTLADS